jgi:hypothetical protein
MASSLVKVEDRLEGASNFNAWKCRILNILEEGDLDELVTWVIEEPTSNTCRATYKKRQAKANVLKTAKPKPKLAGLTG